jgi:hypothetical protein
MGESFTTGTLRLDIGTAHFLAVFQRSLVCDPAFYHHGYHIDFSMTMQSSFTFGEESSVREVNKIADPIPGARLAMIAEDLRSHHQTMFAQTRETTKG